MSRNIPFGAEAEGSQGRTQEAVAMDVSEANKLRKLPTVVSVVGCDGSGKSTLTTDIFEKLRHSYTAEWMYLGQDSGNILRAILEVPVIGSLVGRFLVKKSKKAHSDGKKSAEPDGLTAVVVYLLSCWRHRKFHRMLEVQARGTVIITDRYPQVESQGFYFDGPGLSRSSKASAFVRWLARREYKLYEEMASYTPALIIRLNVDAETAYSRKPDHKLEMLRDKVKVIPTLTFNGAEILDLNGADPYPEVLSAAMVSIDSVLRPLGIEITDDVHTRIAETEKG